MLDSKLRKYHASLIPNLKSSRRDTFLSLEASNANALSAKCQSLRLDALSNASTQNTTISPLPLSTPSNASAQSMKVPTNLSIPNTRLIVLQSDTVHRR